jgi:hypothetical protein
MKTDNSRISQIVSQRFLPIAATAMGLALLFTLAAPPAAEAQQVRFGVRAGIYTDVSEPFIGVDALTRLGATMWYFNPNVEYVLVSNGTLLTINGDFHYDFRTGSPNTFFWVGGGPAIIYTSPPGVGSDTDFGLNLLAGVGMRAGGMVPYLQGKLVLADNNEAVIAVGLRF